MNNRPTPETDQFKVKFKTVCGEKYWVPLELSERLELELNEARKELEEYRSIAESIGAVKAVSEKEKAICERDEAWEKLKPLRQSLLDSQDEVLRLTFENRKISQELDEAMDTIMKIEEIFIDSEDAHDDWMKVGNIARTFCEKCI